MPLFLKVSLIIGDKRPDLDTQNFVSIKRIEEGTFWAGTVSNLHGEGVWPGPHRSMASQWLYLFSLQWHKQGCKEQKKRDSGAQQHSVISEDHINQYTCGNQAASLEMECLCLLIMTNFSL